MFVFLLKGGIKVNWFGKIKSFFTREEDNQQESDNANSLLESILRGEKLTKEKAMSIPAFSSSVDIISNSVAILPIKLYKKTIDKNGKENIEEVKDDIRIKLLNQDPKDTLDSFQLKKAITRDYLIDKGAYIFVEKNRNIFKSLRYVHPSYVSYIKNEDPIFKDGKYTIYDVNNNLVNREITHIDWSVEAATKDGYDHFMLKEIYEQPKVIETTFLRRLNEKDELILDGMESLLEGNLSKFNKCYIVACGTAYHSGLVSKEILEKALRFPVIVDVASEFRYRNPVIDDKTLVIVLSQSGETLDTLEAMKEAKRHGARVVAITNVVGSSVAREADHVIYTWAGPEIAVASTKAYTTQMVNLNLMAIDFAYKFGKITKDEVVENIKKLYEVEQSIQKMLEYDEKIKDVADKIKDSESMFYLGRGLDYVIAVEGALKSKEISYIHSEAFASGELKHGTIALITDGVPVVVNATQSDLFEKSVYIAICSK